MDDQLPPWRSRQTVAILAFGALVVSLGSCSSVDGRSAPASGAASSAPDLVSGSGEVFAGSPRDYQTKLADCLANLGFPSEVVVTEYGDLGVSSSGVDQSTMSDYLKADSTCTERLPAPPEPQSDADLDQYYKAWSSQHACLTQAGYDIPGLPTLQTFVATYRSGNLLSSPVGFVEPSRQRKAAQDCPPNNENWW